MKLSFCLIFVISFFLQGAFQSPFAFAADQKTTSAKKKWARKISFKMSFDGDLQDTFNLTGDLGANLIGESKKPNPVCEPQVLVREALYREKKSIEIWLRLLCTFDAQKKEFKYNRFFIHPEKSINEISLPAQFDKLKKITLKIEDLEIKSNQSK